MVLAALLLPLVLAGCGRLDQLVYDPPTTPEQWCAARPCIAVGGSILNEPFGTALVALLTVLWFGAGARFLATARGQHSRRWLGVALVLGGCSAGMAGISYQAFSYELKCAGWQLCRLTTGWEVGYSVTQALAVSAMLVAVAFATTLGRARRAFVALAAASAVGYVVVAAAGVLLPSATLLSFPVLMLFAVPGLLLVMVLAWRGWRRTGDHMHRSLLVAALLQVAVQAAYFVAWLSGMTAALWDGGAGVYISENDVLHLGMVLWLGYVMVALGPTLHDAQPAAVLPIAGGAPRAAG